MFLVSMCSTLWLWKIAKSFKNIVIGCWSAKYGTLGAVYAKVLVLFNFNGLLIFVKHV